MTSLPKEIKPTLSRTLPGDKGGYVLANAEAHHQLTNKQFFLDHFDELVTQHNVGTIANEMPHYMMLFIWAHRDGKLLNEKGDVITNQAEADQMLRDVFAGYAYDVRAGDISDPAYALQADLAIKANQTAGVDYVTYDTRGLWRVAHPTWKERIDTYSKHPAPIGSLQGVDAVTATMALAGKIYDANPDYAAKINAIDDWIALMQQQKIKTVVDGKEEERWIPVDVRSAKLATAMANEKRNMITISGTTHIAGMFHLFGEREGIFDDALEASPEWKNVSTIKLGTYNDLNQELTFAFHHRLECDVYGLLDTLYITDRGEVVEFDPKSSRAAKGLHDRDPYSFRRIPKTVDGLTEDPFFCNGSRPVSEKYTGEQLDPTRIRALAGAFSELRTTLRAREREGGPVTER